MYFFLGMGSKEEDASLTEKYAVNQEMKKLLPW